MFFLHDNNYKDEQPEEVEVNFPRYRPETLQQLCKLTKFSRKELQLMYRGFKEGCPSGLVTLEQFKDIYSCFFPQGDSTRYATFIFNTFDRDKNGQISFDEFVLGLSVLSRGTEDEKLRWVFNLYDVDNDGYLTRHDIETVLVSIYDMMGQNTDPPVAPDTVKNHVDAIFQKMDDNSDGLITFPEFLHNCKRVSAFVRKQDSHTWFLEAYSKRRIQHLKARFGNIPMEHLTVVELGANNSMTSATKKSMSD